MITAPFPQLPPAVPVAAVTSAAGTSATATVSAAIIAAAVSILVAAGTQWLLSRREATARRYSRRRDTLLAAQDCALVLRGRLRDYGRLSRTLGERPGRGFDSPAFLDAERAFDDALGALDVARTRIDDPAIVAALSTWVDQAKVRFVSTLDVSVAQEQASWNRLNDLVGRALVSSDGQSSR